VASQNDCDQVSRVESSTNTIVSSMIAAFGQDGNLPTPQ